MHAASLATAIAAATVLAAPQAQAAESLLATHDATGTQAFVEVRGDRALFRSLGPATVHVSYDIDVDGDGRIDPAVDVTYGTGNDGTLCVAKWISERATSYCGQARSTGRASQESIGNLVLRRIEMPLSEVSRKGHRIRLRLSMYPEGKAAAQVWIGYDVATGRVSREPGPVASAASKPAQSNTAATTASAAAARYGGLTQAQLTARRDAGKEWLSQLCTYDNLPEIRQELHATEGRYGRFAR